jgi:DNA-binding NarL/FixJ family response regulator
MIAMGRVLLADDQIVVRLGLRALLEARGDFEICGEASNGRAAVDLAIQHTPDVVILDISHSFFDVIEATRQIREETKGETEVMVFTSHKEEYEIRCALRAGARSYILKSEGGEQIVRAVETLTSHKFIFDTRSEVRGIV